MREQPKLGMNGGDRSSLKDAATTAQVWGDVLFLLCVQALPLPLTLLSAYLLNIGNSYPIIIILFSLNAFSVAITLRNVSGDRIFLFRFIFLVLVISPSRSASSAANFLILPQKTN